MPFGLGRNSRQICQPNAKFTADVRVPRNKTAYVLEKLSHSLAEVSGAQTHGQKRGAIQSEKTWCDLRACVCDVLCGAVAVGAENRTAVYHTDNHRTDTVKESPKVRRVVWLAASFWQNKGGAPIHHTIFRFFGHPYRHIGGALRVQAREHWVLVHTLPFRAPKAQSKRSCCLLS